MNTVLFIKPLLDDATRYGFVWMQEAEIIARQYGWNSIRLDDKHATRENFEKALTEHPIDTIVAEGHGLKKEYFGDDMKPVIDMENARLLRDKTFFALSCWLGSTLGEEVANQGGDFLGWQVPVEWVLGKAKDPVEDAESSCLGDVNRMICTKLFTGSKVEEAFTSAMKVFDIHLEYWEQEYGRTARKVTKLLLKDRDGLIAWTP